MEADLLKLIEEMGFTCRLSIPFEGFIAILPKEIFKIVENYSLNIDTENFDNVINNIGKYMLIRTLHDNSIQVNSLCKSDAYKVKHRKCFFPECIFISDVIDLESLQHGDIEMVYDMDNKIKTIYYGKRHSKHIDIISIAILTVIPTKTRLGELNHRMIMQKLN